MSDETMDYGEIGDYLDGRLTDASRAAFEERMRRDPALAAEVADLRAIGAGIRESGSGASALGDDFYARARARFESESKIVGLDPAGAGARRGFRVPWKAVGVAAACLILVAVFLPEGRMLPPMTTSPGDSIADDFGLNERPAGQKAELDKLEAQSSGTAGGTVAGLSPAQSESKDRDQRKMKVPLSEEERQLLERQGERRATGWPSDKDEELKELRALGYVGDPEGKKEAAAPPLPLASKNPAGQPAEAAPAASPPPVPSGGAGPARADANDSASAAADEPLNSAGNLSKTRTEAASGGGASSSGTAKPEGAARAREAAKPNAITAQAPDAISELDRKKSDAAAAKPPACLNFEPAVARLTGVLVLRVFPGPPAYKSIEGGDAPESVWLIQLDSPVCVRGNPAEKLNARTVSALTLIQLELTAPPDENSTVRAGARVEATGKLSTGHTEHHRTQVVLGDARLVEAQ